MLDLDWLSGLLPVSLDEIKSINSNDGSLVESIEVDGVTNDGGVGG